MLCADLIQKHRGSAPEALHALAGRVGARLWSGSLRHHRRVHQVGLVDRARSSEVTLSTCDLPGSDDLTLAPGRPRRLIRCTADVVCGYLKRTMTDSV
jgi:hypothetical protein